MDHYSHHVSGRLATRIAIRKNEAYWVKAVKDKTGKDLAAHKYDPALVVEAIQKDFVDLLNAAGKVDPDGKKGMAKAVKKSMDAYNKKIIPLIDQLHGIPAKGKYDDPRWRAAGRIALRAPMLAHMGGTVISSLSDIAALSAIAGVSGRRQWIVFKGMFELLPFAKTSRRSLEALEVAMGDGMKRTLISGSIEDPIGDAAFDSLDTFATKAMRKADNFTDKATHAFGTFTGINRWNQNMRSTAATLLTDDLVQGAQQMAKAHSLHRNGMKLSEALRKAGLSQQRAQWLNRLGMNADRAKRMLTHLQEHGFDKNGQQPWKQASSNAAALGNDTPVENLDIKQVLHYVANNQIDDFSDIRVDGNNVQEAAMAFKTKIVDRGEFDTPLHKRVALKIGHFFKLVSEGPAKEKGRIKSATSAQEAIDMVMSGKATPDMLNGYQPDRASDILLVRDVLEKPDVILKQKDIKNRQGYVFVNSYKRVPF